MGLDLYLGGCCSKVACGVCGLVKVDVLLCGGGCNGNNCVKLGLVLSCGCVGV